MLLDGNLWITECYPIIMQRRVDFWFIVQILWMVHNPAPNIICFTDIFNTLIGSPLDPYIITLMDKITEPASWFTTLIYKPIYVFQTMSFAIPWKIKARSSVTHPPIASFFQALRTSPPPFPTDNLKIAAAGFCWGSKHAMLLAQDALSSRV